MRVDWLKIVFVQLNGDIELACAVDVVMARAKRINILIIEAKQVVFFFLVVVYSVFLSAIQTLVKVWENSKKLWKYSPAAHVPTAFLVLPNFQSCLYNSIETWYMFSIS